jgi:hypothetical protein
MKQPTTSKPRRRSPARSAAAAANNPIAPEDIARLAHSYWEARGGIGGSPEEDWLRAERELSARGAPKASAAAA